MLGINFKRLNPLSNIAKREFVGIDFTGNNLKLGYVRGGVNKMEVVNLISKSIGGLADEELSKAIRSAFYELRVKTTEIVNIIPAHLVITKNIEIPSTDPQEIKEIINLQAGRHTPYSREEIIVDYIEIGTYKNNYTKILLVILARNVAKKQLEILERSGLRVTGMLLAPEANARFICNILKLENQPTPTNIIHIDESFTDFTMVLKSKVIFIRSIPIGCQHLMEEKEKYLARFVEEVKRSLEAYHIEEIEKSPNQIILTGAIQDLQDVENILNESLHLPIKVMPYLTSLSLSSEAGKIASLTKRLSFLNVVTPLILRSEVKINLIPEELKLRKSLEERGKDLIRTGIFVLTIFVLIFSILITKIYFKNAYLGKLNKKYQALNQKVQDFEADFSKIGTIKNFLLKRGFPLEVLTELYNVAPLDLELTNIRLDEQGKFTISGTAESRSVVFSFVESLGKSKYFKNVKPPKYTTNRKVGGRDLVDFEITSQINAEVSER